MKPPEDFLGRKNWADTASFQEMYRDRKAERDYELINSVTSGPQKHAENVQQAIVEHIDTLQKNLSANEELQVSCHIGSEVIQVHRIVLPNWHVLILLGKDTKGSETSAIMNMHMAQLVCKVNKVESSREPVRIGFILPGQE